jgi:hypothetical protein
MKAFRKFLRNLPTPALHSLWLMERSRMTFDQIRLLKAEANQRQQFLGGSVKNEEFRMWLLEIQEELAEEEGENHGSESRP